MSIIAIDIETIPDVSEATMQRWAEEASPPSNWKDPVKIQRYKEEAALKKKEKAALSPLSGRIVCVGLGYKEKEDEDWEFACFVDASNDECALLIQVDETLSHLPGVSWIVSFYGRKFDFPFLAVRAMKHRLDLNHKWPLGKWDKRHIDMFDAFTEGGLGAWGEFLLGMPKSGSGQHVEEYVNEGRWDDIEAYCLRDVQITAGLWDLYSQTTAGGYYGQISGSS
jgi:hypothetical protein